MIDIMNFIKKLTDTNESELLPSSKIRSLVIESTSRCNLKCVMCPRKSFKHNQGDINLEVFKKISRYFSRGIEVDLAGWGEPLLHPELCELIRIAKEKGGIVGFTTNATLLDAEKSINLINSGLDCINFSIDGATPETYENIRHGAKFKDVIINIKNFITLKTELNSTTPRTSVTFVMMKKNFYELPLLIKLAKELKIDVLNIKNFNVLTNEKDIEQAVFTHRMYNLQDNSFIVNRDLIIAESISLAKNLNLELFISPIEPNVSNKCMLASSALFISHTGDVAICCATGYPVPRMLNRKDRSDDARIIYGNINKNRLDKILNTKRYQECKIKAESNIIPVECNGCLLSEGV